MVTKSTSSSTNRRTSLKSKNNAYLWIFIGINLAIFFSVLISNGFDGSSIDQLWKRVTTKNGIIAAGIPILAIVLTGFLNDVTKARLVFWRWRNPLPGCRAFTELMKTDPRIDVPALKRKLGDLPRNPQMQNALWYQIYKKYRDSVVVSDAHRFYLLTRDIATLSAIFVALLSLGVVLSSVSWKPAAIYGAALIAQYLIVATSARNYGTRFVLNVLTEESHSK